MKKEVNIFLTALMFYTRIPCPSWVEHSNEYLEKATRYFSLIGLIVGAITATIFYLANLIFPVPISIMLSMISSILVTGAFHEDGLADVCDGFGGGWTSEKILEIMKDSRIGTYGAVGLILAFLMKFFASIELSDISINYFIATIVLAHVLSRYNAVNVILLYKYARADNTSKTKPLAKELSFGNYIVMSLVMLVPLIYVSWLFSSYTFMVLLPLFLVLFFMGRYFKKWIGGFTGDCLGAVQQVSEIVIYLFMIGLWKFI